MATKRNMGDEIVFLQEFNSRKQISDNDGVISGTGLTLADGQVTTNGTDDLITYEPNIVPASSNGTIAMDLTIVDDLTISSVLTSADTSGITKFFLVGLDDSNRLTIIHRDGGTQTFRFGTQVLTTGVKYRVTWSTDSSSYFFSINGVEDVLQGSGGTEGGWYGDVSDRDNFVFGGLVRSSTTYSNIKVGNVIFTPETWTTQEKLDDYNNTTYSALDAKKSLIALPLRSNFNDGSNDVTSNLGTEGNLVRGDGSTGSTQPTQIQPKGNSFDGGDYLETADTVALASTDSYVFHCRFKSNSGLNDYFMDWRAAAANEGIGAFVNGSGNIVAFADTSTVTTTGVYNDGIERDIVITWNNSASNVLISIYIDGVLDNSVLAVASTAVTNKIVIGDWRDKTLGWVGNLKDVGLWKTTGTPRQVRWLNQRSLKEINI